MSLIEQLAGYGECERLRKVPAASSFRIRGIEFTREELERAMLEYRRANNIFENDDKVVMIKKNRSPKIWTWVHTTNWRPNHSLINSGESYLTPICNDEIRHATDEEIAAGHRL